MERFYLVVMGSERYLSAHVRFYCVTAMLTAYYRPMRLHFREDKATQAAARLIKHAGGTMNHMKLIKLLYLAEHRAV